MTLISVAAPPDRQGQVSAGLQTAVAAGSIVGPAIGGQVSAAFDVRAVFLLVAALTTLSALLVLLLAREAPGLRRPAESGARRASALGGAIEDFRVVLQSRELRAALWIVFWIQFGLGATNPILELHVRDLVGGAEALRSTSLLFSAMAAANLPAILLWGRYGDRIGHRAAMLRCALASAAAFALHALAPGYGLLFAARVLLGASMAGLAPSAFGLAAAEISADRRGSAFGTVFSARALAVAISAALGGWLSRYVGVPGLFLAGAVLVLASAVGLRRAAVKPA
jgi:DHA1 family multidrug resistance protein-like MFS transporter